MAWTLADANELHRRRLSDTEFMRTQILLVADRERAMTFRTIGFVYLAFLLFLVFRGGAQPPVMLGGLIVGVGVVAVLMAFFVHRRVKAWMNQRMADFETMDANEFVRFGDDLVRIGEAE